MGKLIMIIRFYPKRFGDYLQATSMEIDAFSDLQETLYNFGKIMFWEGLIIRRAIPRH